MKKFYEVPTQVKFIESADVVDEPHWIGGIAYQDYVICGECGGIIDLEDLAAIVEFPWVDISNEIIGVDITDELIGDDDLDLDEEWGDDGNLECGFDPYSGCYSDDC